MDKYGHDYLTKEHLKEMDWCRPSKDYRVSMDCTIDLNQFNEKYEKCLGASKTPETFTEEDVVDILRWAITSTEEFIVFRMDVKEKSKVKGT
tara:strand:+ start:478 stop:753 length:276 start_codon:yes stop_codon:yes gene_type:complete